MFPFLDSTRKVLAVCECDRGLLVFGKAQSGPRRSVGDKREHVVCKWVGVVRFFAHSAATAPQTRFCLGNPVPLCDE